MASDQACLKKCDINWERLFNRQKGQDRMPSNILSSGVALNFDTFFMAIPVSLHRVVVNRRVGR